MSCQIFEKLKLSILLEKFTKILSLIEFVIEEFP